MTSYCHTPIRGVAVRLTRISTYGVPVTGAGAFAVSSSFTTVGMADDVDTPDEYRIRAATGGCKAVRAQPKLNFIDVSATFCRADPELFSLASGQPVIGDAFGNAVGWGAEHVTYATGSFALEVWTRLTGTTACTGTGTALFGYLLLPWIVGGVQGPITFDRGVVDFTFKATTQPGNVWGVGPYNVVPDALGTPGRLLTPVPTQRQRHWQVTSVPAPAALCGAQAWP